MDLTPTQQRIINTLSDGKRHHKKQLHSLLLDDEADERTVAVHMHYLRKKLRPLGEDIICEYYRRGIHYRHVRLISPYG